MQKFKTDVKIKNVSGLCRASVGLRGLFYKRRDGRNTYSWKGWRIGDEFDRQ